MTKQKSAKGFNHLATSQGVLCLLMWLYDFRTSYGFSDAALWDVIFIYYYHSRYLKGPTINALRVKKYGYKTGYKATRERLDVLIKRGLIYQVDRRLYPAELLLKELTGAIDLDELSKFLPAA